MKSYTILALFIGAVLTLAGARTTSAHEHQIFQIGGKEYSFTVGSLNEPIVVDDKTGVDVRIVSGKTPVAGLDQTLKVELSAGDIKKVLPLAAAYNDPGAYKAVFFPTVATTLNYRLFGTIENNEVDLTFTCNPAGHPKAPEDTKLLKISNTVTRTRKSGAFGCALEKAGMGFPEKSSDIVSIEKSVVRDDSKTDLSGIALILSVAALGLTLIRRRS